MSALQKVSWLMSTSLAIHCAILLYLNWHNNLGWHSVGIMLSGTMLTAARWQLDLARKAG